MHSVGGPGVWYWTKGWVNLTLPYCAFDWMEVCSWFDKLLQLVCLRVYFHTHLCFYRRLSPPKRTLVGKLVRLHGQQNSAPFMASQLWTQISSMRGTHSGTLAWWQKKPDDAQRLQGWSVFQVWTLLIVQVFFKLATTYIGIKTLLMCSAVFVAMQTKGASHSQRKGGVLCEVKGFGHWSQPTLHSLNSFSTSTAASLILFHFDIPFFPHLSLLLIFPCMSLTAHEAWSFQIIKLIKACPIMIIHFSQLHKSLVAYRNMHHLTRRLD